jgi:hypothetical protein
MPSHEQWVQYGDGRVRPGRRIAFSDPPPAASLDTIAAAELEVMPAFDKQMIV